MMSVQLTLRADGEVLSWQVDDWSALVALAALSAEPETSEEFFAALRRYQPDHRWDHGTQPSALEDALGGDRPACLIDLDSHTVFASGGFELPERGGAYQADEEDRAEGFPFIWIDLPEDWLFENGGANWLAIIRDREGVRGQRIDTRAVLFGRPMLEFVAKRVLAAATEGEVDEEQRYEQIRAIHADWLMTPREDLRGRTPREVLLHKRDQIERDIQHRSDQWSRQGFAPPALDKEAAAYRFGGYGVVEIVSYFDLMRALLMQAWQWAQRGRLQHAALGERLAAAREAFLDQPPEDGGSDLTCRELIESERRRMPMTADGSHLDCDCPICQAIADGELGSQPMFMFFDGHHLELEDTFAFSLTKDRQQWESDQEDFRSYVEAVDYEESQRESVDGEAVNGETADGETASVWTSSFVDWDNVLGSGDSPISAKIALGFPLSELLTELQQREASRIHIDALNAALTRFRRADDRAVEQSAAEQLRDCLEHVASDHQELIPRCADLQSRLDEVLRSLP